VLGREFRQLGSLVCEQLLRRLSADYIDWSGTVHAIRVAGNCTHTVAFELRFGHVEEADDIVAVNPDDTSLTISESGGFEVGGCRAGL
jgi:hypothetical protein